MPHLITLTGPSQSGKSTAISEFLAKKTAVFLPISVPKFTTRPKREDDKDWEVLSADSLSSDLDLVYQQYGYRYGLSSKTIFKMLKKGLSPILVLNDVRLITETKRLFGPVTRSIFVFRNPPNQEEFIESWNRRSSRDSEAIRTRLKKAEAIYRIYIENIFLFDNVIINSGGLASLENQIDGIIESLGLPSWKFVK